MKKYDKYRDSGIEWIGEIPKNWKIKKIKKNIKDLIGGGTPQSRNEEYWAENENEGTPWVSIKDISKNTIIIKTEKRVTESGIRSKNLRVLKKGTLLYSIFATLGKTSILGIDATTNQAILGIIPKEGNLERDYLKYFLIDFERNILSLSSPNTQENLNSTKIKNLKMCLPPKEEQIQIADYLDDKNSKINKTIENKKRQINLLKENEQIVINSVFLNGLNKKKYKRTEIKWSPTIPENWELRRMKYLTTKIGSGKTPRGGSENYPEEGIIFIRSQNVYFDSLKLEDVKYIYQETHDEMNNTKVQPEDLLLNITGASIGRIGIFPEKLKEANVNQHVSIIRSNEQIMSRYLQYFLYSYSGQVNIYAVQNGASKEGLSSRYISCFKVPYCSKDEQKRIIEYLDKYSKNNTKSIKIIQSEIENIQKYQQIILNDVVTGKMKVTA